LANYRHTDEQIQPNTVQCTFAGGDSNSIVIISKLTDRAEKT